MPNIKVVSQAKKSPLLDIVIDLEETVNPLGASSRSSVRIKAENAANNTPTPMIIDEEDPI